MFATILFQIHDGSVSPENTGSWSFHVVVLERTAKLKKTTSSLSFLSRLVEGNEQASERARKSPAALLRFFFFVECSEPEIACRGRRFSRALRNNAGGKFALARFFVSLDYP